MKLIVKQSTMGLGIALLLSGCGSFDGKRDGIPAAEPAPLPSTTVRDGPPKLGAAFTIDGTSYTPADIPDYDAVGYASWYGDEFAGKKTANGETYNPAAISAAHKTLPLPSYVEVTALDTGRTILVRVNDRGPMKNDRLIDLSEGAARQLGLTGAGVAAVRVRRTSPPASERAELRAGRPVTERLPTPDSLLAILRKKIADQPMPVPAKVAAAPSKAAPAAASTSDRFIVEGGQAASANPAQKNPATTPAKPASGQYVVQVAAFSSKARAEATAKAVGGQVSHEGPYWRVRMGPFSGNADAEAARSFARSKGFGDARVMRDR